MSQVETAGVVVLTAAAGGGAAFGLAAFLIWWHRISKSEGGAGYFSVLATLAGIAGGFVIGLAAALMGPGFRAAGVRALSAVAGLTVFAGIFAVVIPALRAMSKPVSGRLAGRSQVRPGGRSTPVRGNSPRRPHRKATTPSGKR